MLGVIERERKYRLSADVAAQIAATLDRVATFDRREIQETVHFADRQGRLGDLNLRLRTIGARQELTVKGPRLEDGPSKVREEHTIVVDGDVAPVMAALGLVPSVRYRKLTAIFAYDGALVSLDEVEGIGRFCEVEAADDTPIERVSARLGLTGVDLEPRGYARLQRARARNDVDEVR